MRRSAIVCGALVVGVLWGVICLGVNAWRVGSVYLPEPWSPESPLEWRAETPPTGNLRTLLQRVDERIPEISSVAFSCPQPTREEEFRCFQWASYWLLPRRETRFVASGEGTTADHLVVYDPDGGATQTSNEAGEPLVVTEHGAIYEIDGSSSR